MVGGSILDETDWRHLQRDYGLAGVINVESEHSDQGKGIILLFESGIRWPDDAQPRPAIYWRTCIDAARAVLAHGPVYIHCQMGGSRSPAVAYAVLRMVFKYSPEKARDALLACWPFYDVVAHHVAYLQSFEATFGET